MKAMESLLALSVLATLGTGAANATTVATYDVAVTPLDIIYHFPGNCDTLPADSCPVPTPDADILNHGSSYGISGSAVLDDSGTLTITSTYREATVFDTDTTFGSVITVVGSWDGTTFTAASGSFHFTSCIDSSVNITCDLALLHYGGQNALAIVSGSASASNGSLTSTWSLPSNDRHYQYVLSNGTPAVPVPAAAWLFGSGLLGLVGAARRRTT